MRKIDLSNFRVATSETARLINRRIVLNLVRTHQPISRADLARVSGLQRSTVSLIVEQLIKEKWIIEGAVGQLPRGRRPTFLHLNTERARIVGINIRPGTTAIAIADFTGKIVAQESMETPQSPGTFVKALVTQVKQFLKAHPNLNFEGIGVSLPGRATHDAEQRVIFAPNVGWRDLDLKGPLEKATGLPVELENASNACALAEIWFGSHDSMRDLVSVTVSEGIGVGIVANGELLTGLGDMAGEFGHVPIAFEGPSCRCGNKACWEVFASNSAAVRFYREILDAGANRKNGNTHDESYEDVLQLAARGDRAAVDALEKQAYFLGRGLLMLVNGLSPSAILIVGELTRAWERVGPIIRKVVKDHILTEREIKFLPADEAMQPRLRGTFALVMQKHFGAPMVA